MESHSWEDQPGVMESQFGENEPGVMESHFGESEPGVCFFFFLECAFLLLLRDLLYLRAWAHANSHPFAFASAAHECTPAAQSLVVAAAQLPDAALRASRVCVCR